MSVTIRAVTSSERLTRLSCFLSATSWRALRLEYLGMARPPRRPEKAQWPPRRGGGGRRTATQRPGSGRRRTDKANGTGAPRAVATGWRGREGAVLGQRVAVRVDRGGRPATENTT